MRRCDMLCGLLNALPLYWRFNTCCEAHVGNMRIVVNWASRGWPGKREDEWMGLLYF
jgi:hypothetical protein